MSIFDHLSVGVGDIGQAGAFYDGLLELLGCQAMVRAEGLIAYGNERVQFLAMLPGDGQAPTFGNGTHIAFAADSRETVDQFHALAMANGGQCEGKPGPREAYPIPDVYTAYVRDPWGNKLEVIHNGFSV